jgi:hypothetical protein
MVHAVYLKTRLPHKSIQTTPLQAYTGQRPNVRNIRVFGCPVVAKLPGKRPAKLDSHTAMGIFLGYTATEHNVYYQDLKTKKVKIAMHIAFDEAGYSLTPATRTKSQVELMLTHHELQKLEPDATNQNDDHPTLPHDNKLVVTKLSPTATLPIRMSSDAAGYDLYSAEEITIALNKIGKVQTDIAIHPPQGT